MLLAVTAALCAAQSTLAPAERAALVDLYLATNGPAWSDQGGWNYYNDPSSDPCTYNW